MYVCMGGYIHPYSSLTGMRISDAGAADKVDL